MKKAITSMVLTATMAVALFAGTTHASEQALDGTWPESRIKIGVEVYDTTDATVIGYTNYFNYLSDYYNVEFMFSESISDAEAEFAFADSCAAAGCQGYIGGYNASMDSIVNHVTDLGMYYWGAERGLDEVFKENPYYLGGFMPVVTGASIEGNGDYLLGYDLAYTLASEGSTHIAYCNGGTDFGIQMFIDRQEGFIDGIAAAQADGYDVKFDKATDIIPGWPGTDEFAARQTPIISGDYDAVAVSFSGVEVWYQPILDAGKQDQIKIAGVGAVNDSIVGIASTGAVAALVYECEEVVFGNAVVMIINAVNGHADMIKEPEGYCRAEINRWTITQEQDFQTIFEKHDAGEYYITAEDMAQFFPELNENASREEFIEFYRSMTLEKALGK